MSTPISNDVDTAAYLDTLSRVGQRRFASTHEAMAAILRLLVEQLRMRTSLIARATGEADRFEVVAVYSEPDGCALAEGSVLRLPHESCVNGTGSPEPCQLVIGDATKNGAFAAHPSRAQLNIGSYIGVPIFQADGTLFGLLCALDPAPRRLRPQHAELMAALARVLAAQLAGDELAEHRRAERRLAAQYAATRVLAEGLTLDEAARGVLQAIGEHLGWEWGALWSVDQDASVLRCVQTWHAPSRAVGELEELTQQVTLSRGVGLPGRVWVSGEPIWLADVTAEASSRWVLAAVEAGLRAAIGFPILGASEVLGVMEFLGREPREPDDELCAMLAAIGSQVGQFVERKRAEEALARQALTLREQADLLDLAYDAISVRDRRGTILFWNHGAEAMFGWGKHEACGANIYQLLQTEWPEPLAAIEAELLRAGAWEGELVHTRRDGTRIVVASRWALQRSENREPRAILEIDNDVTQRKRAEEALRQSEEQLRQSQKMEAIGRLAGGVAHDFNNVLTAINGFSELLLLELSADDPRRAYVDEIAKAGERAAALTRQLLVFSRQQMVAPQIVDLNAIVVDIEAMLHRVIGEDVELRTVPAPALGSVKADPSLIQQVILNLVVNARDAMPQGGQLIIETANVEVAAPAPHPYGTVLPGAYVMLAVSDTGCGMDATTQARIFEPFFTTKERNKGTGLGLAMVYGIVTQSGGHIWVYSELGIGSTFKIYFPRVEGAAEPGAAPAALAGQPGGSETILLVEDDLQVR